MVVIAFKESKNGDTYGRFCFFAYSLKIGRVFTEIWNKCFCVYFHVTKSKIIFGGHYLERLFLSIIRGDNMGYYFRLCVRMMNKLLISYILSVAIDVRFWIGGFFEQKDQ